MREKIQVVKEIATFEDLTKEEKVKVLDNYRYINVDEGYWHDDTIADFKCALEKLGFVNPVINYSGFYSQGDGASFTGKFKVPKNKAEINKRIKSVLSCFPKFDLSLFNDLKFSQEEIEEEVIEVYRTGHRYYHSNTISCDNESLENFAKSFSDFIYKTLEAEFDSLTTDESVQDTLVANKYTFDTSNLKICNY